MTPKHPLEEVLNADAWDILSAIQGGFRAIIDVKGKLAEYFLERELARLVQAQQLQGYQWQDKDGQPDFLIPIGGRTLRLECKNVRSGVLFGRPPTGYKVELQKTRNSKDGKPTRGYGFDEFDLLAVCLFNHTKNWDYRYVRARDLSPRDRMPELIKIMQCVPFQAEGMWTDNLLDAIRSVPVQ